MTRTCPVPQQAPQCAFLIHSSHKRGQYFRGGKSEAQVDSHILTSDQTQLPDSRRPRCINKYPVMCTARPHVSRGLVAKELEDLSLFP